MTIELFIDKLKKTGDVDFNELMSLIATYYHFNETAFDNGGLHNKAGENSGSCQLFSFAKIHQLTKQETLNCFGDYYKEVLQQPDSNHHQNIRHFMETGWNGLVFNGSALSLKK